MTHLCSREVTHIVGVVPSYTGASSGILFGKPLDESVPIESVRDCDSCLLRDAKSSSLARAKRGVQHPEGSLSRRPRKVGARAHCDRKRGIHHDDGFSLVVPRARAGLPAREDTHCGQRHYRLAGAFAVNPRAGRRALRASGV